MVITCVIMRKEKSIQDILEFFGFKLIVRIRSTHPRLPFKTIIQVLYILYCLIRSMSGMIIVTQISPYMHHT